MKYCALFMLCVYLGFQQTSSRVFTRCGLTDELLRQGFSRSFVGNWVCLIESESAKDTSKVTNKANGGKALGLFQINSKEWCKFQTPGGKCNMKCEDLLNEDITDDSVCAKIIQGQKGFRGWDGWKRSCKGRTLTMPYFTNEDISDDSTCAKKIYGEIGFQAWDGWKRNCKGKTLPIPCNNKGK